MEGDEFYFRKKQKGVHKRKSRGEFRGSKFRGVSKNGKQWQVFIMIGKSKRYIGIVGNELDAARYYDALAIQNHGIRAKTNFEYSKTQILEILDNVKY